MVDELVALTREECMFWSQKVMSYHSLWRKRVRGIDCYSLGISYDALSRYGGFNQDWKNAVSRNNQEMSDAFDGLYKQVSELFANFFGKPISLSNCLAVPGFIILDLGRDQSLHSLIQYFLSMGGRYITIQRQIGCMRILASQREMYHQ